MTYQHNCTLPKELLEQIAQQGIDAIPEMIRTLINAAMQLVEDEVFFQIMQTYVARFAHSNVTTDDFIAVAEEVSGQELGEFFNAWLYESGLPPLPEQ